MSLTSATKPPVDSFLINPSTTTYEITDPRDVYIYTTNIGATTFLVLPVANTIYAGFKIRVSNLQSGIINVVAIGVKSPNVFFGSSCDPGTHKSFMTDGVNTWYEV
jgi:hypothetical protein